MRVADHFEEVIGLRVAALEARVAAEAESVKEHFAELQNFITFSLTRQITQLKEELSLDIRRVEQRLERLEQRFDGLEQRFESSSGGSTGSSGGSTDSSSGSTGSSTVAGSSSGSGLDRKFDAHHEAIKLILSDILARLPASRS